MPPSIEIKYFDGTQVIWEDYDIDDDATIILGLDNDMKDVDGIWIADNLSEDKLDGIVLNTNVPTGTYYLYAIIKDSLGQQHFDYYPTPVTFIQDGAPATPTGLNYQTTDSTLTFFVDSSTSDQYILYYSTVYYSIWMVFLILQLPCMYLPGIYTVYYIYILYCNYK